MATLLEELINQGRYAAINIYMLSQDEVHELIAHLRNVVPRERYRYLRPEEITDTSLKQAAALLANDELHALAEDDVPSPQERWEGTLAAIECTLAPYADDTAPVPDASPPADHVTAIRALLDDIAHDLSIYQANADTPEEAVRITEMHCRSMLVGFHIGQNAQLALRAPFLRAYAGEIQPLLDARLAQHQAQLQRDEAQARNALLSGAQDKVEIVHRQRHRGQIGNALRAHEWQRVADSFADAILSDYRRDTEALIARGIPLQPLLKKQLAAKVTDALRAHYRATDPDTQNARLSERSVTEYLYKRHDGYRRLDRENAAFMARAKAKQAAIEKARNTFLAPKI